MASSFATSHGPPREPDAREDDGVRLDLAAIGAVATQRLAAAPTRLAAIDMKVQERLINWGYAICDAAMRLHIVQGAGGPTSVPYGAVGVGEMPSDR